MAVFEPERGTLLLLGNPAFDNVVKGRCLPIYHARLA